MTSIAHKLGLSRAKPQREQRAVPMVGDPQGAREKDEYYNAPPAVWRLDFDGPKEWHLNDVPEMHECPRLIYGPHYHPWRLNRAGVKRGRLPTELPLAMPLPAMRGFDATLHWFCDETRITIGKGQIPARPTPGTLL